MMAESDFIFRLEFYRIFDKYWIFQYILLDCELHGCAAFFRKWHKGREMFGVCVCVCVCVCDSQTVSWARITIPPSLDTGSCLALWSVLSEQWILFYRGASRSHRFIVTFVSKGLKIVFLDSNTRFETISDRRGLWFYRQSLKNWRKMSQSHIIQAPPAALVLPYQCLATARVMTTLQVQRLVIKRPTSTRPRTSEMTHSISSNRELVSQEQTVWILRTSHHHHCQESG